MVWIAANSSPDEFDPIVALEAGLYADFGYNGFDYWRQDPYYQGVQCMAQVSDDGWAQYVFDEPLHLGSTADAIGASMMPS